MWGALLSFMILVMASDGNSVELRLAHADDADAVRRLAALDDARDLQGRVLVAFLDGTAVAALSLDEDRVVADPFRPTADVVAVLRLHGRHVAGARARWRPRRVGHLRLA
jgi:hypothetical protein